jgi:hypothetical protein
MGQNAATLENPLQLFTLGLRGREADLRIPHDRAKFSFIHAFSLGAVLGQRAVSYRAATISGTQVLLYGDVLERIFWVEDDQWACLSWAEEVRLNTRKYTNFSS